MRTLAASLALTLALAGCKSTPPPKAHTEDTPERAPEPRGTASDPSTTTSASSGSSTPAAPGYGCSVCGTSASEPGNCPTCGGPMTQR